MLFHPFLAPPQVEQTGVHQLPRGVGTLMFLRCRVWRTMRGPTKQSSEGGEWALLGQRLGDGAMPRQVPGLGGGKGMNLQVGDIFGEVAGDAGQLLAGAVHDGAFAAALLRAHEVHEAGAAEAAAVILRAWEGAEGLGSEGTRPEEEAVWGRGTGLSQQAQSAAWWGPPFPGQALPPTWSWSLKTQGPSWVVDLSGELAGWK